MAERRPTFDFVDVDGRPLGSATQVAKGVVPAAEPSMIRRHRPRA